MRRQQESEALTGGDKVVEDGMMGQCSVAMRFPFLHHTVNEMNFILYCGSVVTKDNVYGQCL